MKIKPVEVDGKFKLLRERRGEWAVKQYVHQWYTYQGEEVFIKFRHKHNRTKEEVATHQHIVDELKPLFLLRQIGTKVVHHKVEGIGVMQKWWPNRGTVKMRPMFQYWVDERGLFELLKICLFDGIIGSLDRHGNNVLVLMDRGLLTIDDEDVFYPLMGMWRTWVKFDKDLKRMAYMCYLRNQLLYEKYVEKVRLHAEEILKVADCPVMKTNPQYEFYRVLTGNLKGLSGIAQITVRQLLY